jgi:transposase
MSDEARYVAAERSQLSWELVDLEALLPSDHRARLVWSFTQGLDLGVFYDAIRSREGHAGRPPADPRILLALWLYATMEGVGSARELARLVDRDLGYRWLAGGVSVNYHGLSDFRVGWSEELDRLLVESVTALVTAGLVSLDEIAVDGTKVRSPASSRSFTRGGRLERIEREARERVERLKAELENDPAASTRRRQAAQERAAREAQAKVDKARKALDKLREEKKKREKTHPKQESKKSAPSVSLSDTEARRMRFADGAVRAGYNIQTAAIPDVGLVVTILATDARNDKGLAAPMIERIVERYDRAPKQVLLDAGYACQGDIERLANHPKGPMITYMPPPTEKPDAEMTPAALSERRYKRARETEAVKAWRTRMQSQEAKDIFGRRKLIERIHAHYKNRGFDRLTVRGMAKAQAIALWQALANNLMVAHRLRMQAATAA